jgi:hypothetical protein
MNSKIILDAELDELLGLLDKNHNQSILNTPPDADGNILLGRAEISRLGEAITETVDIQLDTCRYLTLLAIAFRTLEYEENFSSEERVALLSLTLAQAEIVRSNANLIRKIIN